MITFLRILKNGFVNFIRNGVLSFASTTIMVLTLLSLSVFYITSMTVNLGIDYIQEKIDISAFFDYEADEALVLELQSELANLPEVSSVKYVSQDEALERFKEQKKDQKELIESIESLEENPLQASIEVKMDDPDQIENVSNTLEKEEYDTIIAKKENGDKKISYKENKAVVDKLLHYTRIIRNIGIVAITAFGVISFIIIYNTVRIAIFSQKNDIEIMKLVGATNWYIRGPFIFEGMLYGIIATAITMIGLAAMLYYSAPSLNSAFSDIGVNVTSLLYENAWLFFGAQLLLGISIGVFSSWLALRKYLKIQYTD
ncbi:MAG: permease-like cell division protein FtsX [Patescibacteria group bacterium]|nr:permease-like cell division protein FtsX [Patescibacteria group bacterium]